MDETGPGFFNFPKNVPVYFRLSPFIFEIHDLLKQEKKMPRGLRVEGVLQQRVSTNRDSYIQGSNTQGFLKTRVLQAWVLTSRGLKNKDLATRGFLHKESYNQGFLQPGVLQPKILKTRSSYNKGFLTTRGSYNQGFFTTEGPYDQGSYNQGFLKLGVPSTRGLTT